MQNPLSRFQFGIGAKVVLIIVLAALLSIFLAMQDHLVYERQELRNEAVSRTVGEWGGRQKVVGPILRIPYRELISVNKYGETYRDAFAYLLPDDFAAQVNLSNEKRQRGIYEIPLYTADIAVTGNFKLPSLNGWIPNGAKVAWKNAALCFFVESARGLAEKPALSIDGRTADISRSDSAKSNMDSFIMPVSLGDAQSWKFNLNLKLRGGEYFGLAPMGAMSDINVVSALGYPEFGGSYLPGSHDISESGFKADWKIPALARRMPQSGTTETWDDITAGTDFAFVELGVALDSYKMINRAIKYGLLFIVVPFVGLFLFEIFTRKRLHPVQYLLVGLAVFMFYMLILSLSERLDFALAFVLGAMAVCSLVGVYCAAILKGGKSGLVCFGGLAGLYALLYLIVSSEDNALLVGSFFLFSLLAAVMVATRRVNWYRLGNQAAADRPDSQVAGPD